MPSPSTARAGRPKGTGSVHFSRDARGYLVARGRLWHLKRLYATEGVGLGKGEPTQRARAAAVREVERRLLDLRARLQADEQPDPACERRTVGQQLELWLLDVAQTAPRGVRTYEAGVRCHLMPHRIARVPLRSLTDEDVRRWLADLTRAGIGSWTRRYTLNCLVAALRAYLRAHEVASVRRVVNAAHELRPKHRSHSPEPLDEAQSAALLAHLTAHAPEPYGPLLAVQLLLGLRWGEAAAIRVGDLHGLDGPEPSVSIARRVDRHTSEPAPVKSEAGERILPLSADAVAVLVGCRQRALAQGRAWAPDELVFQLRGRPVAYRTTLNQLRRISQAAGLRPFGNTHRLRHTFATLAAADGVPTHVLGGLLGHTDPAMTARYTRHRQPEMRQAVESVGRRMHGSAPA